MSRRFFVGVSSIFLMAAAAWGQQFEVADVRVNKAEGAAAPVQVLNEDGIPVEIQPNPNGISHLLEEPFTESGRVSLRYITMRMLIAIAYKKEIVSGEFLSGGPSWIDSDHFDLIAKALPKTPLDTERLMIRAVLAERFHLQIHRERKPMPVYALVVGKSGPRLQKAAGSGAADCRAVAERGPDHLVCTDMKMPDLAKALPNLAPDYLDKIVVDQTGLSGTYDFGLDWAARRNLDETGGVTIFGAVEKLGLKLEERKAPMPTIVIDRMDRTPAEN
jgi:uncharacterized protein (TIGR03435 family)